jgi:hypothetical protein
MALATQSTPRLIPDLAGKPGNQRSAHETNLRFAINTPPADFSATAKAGGCGRGGPPPEANGIVRSRRTQNGDFQLRHLFLKRSRRSSILNEA